MLFTSYAAMSAIKERLAEMQIKLKQGFGRAIRTETDTCVVAILDERAAPGQWHHEAMLAALPELPITSSLEDVVEFIF